MHKAEPAPQFADDAVSTCVHCHKEIKRVPGGHGPTWVHADSGAVVGRGEPKLTPERNTMLSEAQQAAQELTVLFRRLVPDFPVVTSSEGSIGSNRFYVRFNLLPADVKPLIQALRLALEPADGVNPICENADCGNPLMPDDTDGICSYCAERDDL
jgi:hypothetical protein